MHSVTWVHIIISIINQRSALTACMRLRMLEVVAKTVEGEWARTCPASHNQPEVDYHGVNEN